MWPEEFQDVELGRVFRMALQATDRLAIVTEAEAQDEAYMAELRESLDARGYRGPIILLDTLPATRGVEEPQ